jgi:hypothetical protein
VPGRSLGRASTPPLCGRAGRAATERCDGLDPSPTLSSPPRRLRQALCSHCGRSGALSPVVISISGGARKHDADGMRHQQLLALWPDPHN